jgi:hypothetical protein
MRKSYRLKSRKKPPKNTIRKSYRSKSRRISNHKYQKSRKRKTAAAEEEEVKLSDLDTIERSSNQTQKGLFEELKKLLEDDKYLAYLLQYVVTAGTGINFLDTQNGGLIPLGEYSSDTLLFGRINDMDSFKEQIQELNCKYMPSVIEQDSSLKYSLWKYAFSLFSIAEIEDFAYENIDEAKNSGTISNYWQLFNDNGKLTDFSVQAALTELRNFKTLYGTYCTTVQKDNEDLKREQNKLIDTANGFIQSAKGIYTRINYLKLYQTITRCIYGFTFVLRGREKEWKNSDMNKEEQINLLKLIKFYISGISTNAIFFWYIISIFYATICIYIEFIKCSREWKNLENKQVLKTKIILENLKSEKDEIETVLKNLKLIYEYNNLVIPVIEKYLEIFRNINQSTNPNQSYNRNAPEKPIAKAYNNGKNIFEINLPDGLRLRSNLLPRQLGDNNLLNAITDKNTINLATIISYFTEFLKLMDTSINNFTLEKHKAAVIVKELNIEEPQEEDSGDDEGIILDPNNLYALTTCVKFCSDPLDRFIFDSPNLANTFDDESSDGPGAGGGGSDVKSSDGPGAGGGGSDVKSSDEPGAGNSDSDDGETRDSFWNFLPPALTRADDLTDVLRGKLSATTGDVPGQNAQQEEKEETMHQEEKEEKSSMSLTESSNSDESEGKLLYIKASVNVSKSGVILQSSDSLHDIDRISTPSHRVHCNDIVKAFNKRLFDNKKKIYDNIPTTKSASETFNGIFTSLMGEKNKNERRFIIEQAGYGSDTKYKLVDMLKYVEALTVNSAPAISERFSGSKNISVEDAGAIPLTYSVPELIINSGNSTLCEFDAALAGQRGNQTRGEITNTNYQTLVNILQKPVDLTLYIPMNKDGNDKYFINALTMYDNNELKQLSKIKINFGILLVKAESEKYIWAETTTDLSKGFSINWCGFVADTIRDVCDTKYTPRVVKCPSSDYNIIFRSDLDNNIKRKLEENNPAIVGLYLKFVADQLYTTTSTIISKLTQVYNSLVIPYQHSTSDFLKYTLGQDKIDLPYMVNTGSGDYVCFPSLVLSKTIFKQSLTEIAQVLSKCANKNNYTYKNYIDSNSAQNSASDSPSYIYLPYSRKRTAHRSPPRPRQSGMSRRGAVKSGLSKIGERREAMEESGDKLDAVSGRGEVDYDDVKSSAELIETEMPFLLGQKIKGIVRYDDYDASEDLSESKPFVSCIVPLEYQKIILNTFHDCPNVAIFMTKLFECISRKLDRSQNQVQIESFLDEIEREGIDPAYCEFPIVINGYDDLFNIPDNIMLEDTAKIQIENQKRKLREIFSTNISDKDGPILIFFIPIMLIGVNKYTIRTTIKKQNADGKDEEEQIFSPNYFWPEKINSQIILDHIKMQFYTATEINHECINLYSKLPQFTKVRERIEKPGFKFVSEAVGNEAAILASLQRDRDNLESEFEAAVAEYREKLEESIKIFKGTMPDGDDAVKAAKDKEKKRETLVNKLNISLKFADEKLKNAKKEAKLQSTTQSRAFDLKNSVIEILDNDITSEYLKKLLNYSTIVDNLQEDSEPEEFSAESLVLANKLFKQIDVCDINYNKRSLKGTIKRMRRRGGSPEASAAAESSDYKSFNETKK